MTLACGRHVVKVQGETGDRASCGGTATRQLTLCEQQIAREISMRTYDPHKSTVEVRGADRHQTNRVALIVGTTGVIVAFALIWWWFAAFGHGA